MSKRRKRGPLTGEISDLVQFAAEIRAGRAVLGWSQTELAKRTAVTQRAIYCIEQNIVQYRGSKPKRRIIEAFTDAGFGSSAAGRFQDDGAEHNSEAAFGIWSAKVVEALSLGRRRECACCCVSRYGQDKRHSLTEVTTKFVIRLCYREWLGAINV
jgi:transcriptional regulator with XRE-family HTH domain